MGTTPQGIVYPDPSGTPRRKDLQDLAESVDAALTPAILTAGDLGVTAGPNWAISFFAAARIGLIRVLQVRVTYSGSTLTGGAGGALADTTVLTGVPVDWRPGSAAVFAYSKGVGVNHGSGYLGTNGNVVFGSLSQSATIASGDPVGFNIAYLGTS